LEEQEHQIQQLISVQTKFFQEAADSRLNPKTNSATTVTTQTVEPSTEVKKSFESEQAAYEKAYMFLRAKEYPQAKYAMQTFLKQYPEGQYASNAHYWLAELSLLTGDGVLAAKEFETVIKKYPASPKVSDAMLKIGILHLEKGDKKMAKQQFEQVVTAFPNSASAGIAKKRLQAL
jgi:tol-pal system protein YbgF